MSSTATQRKEKRDESAYSGGEMKKSEVEKQSLGEYVDMPATCNQSFMVWWRSLASEAVVEVRYPHERHGLAGKTSNSEKVECDG